MVKKKNNTIIGTHTPDGRWVEGSDMVSAFVDYFEGLFSTFNPHNLGVVLQLMNHRLTDEMNAELVRDFTSQEVKHVVDHMPIGKSPGPDRLGATFYKNAMILSVLR